MKHWLNHWLLLLLAIPLFGTPARAELGLALAPMRIEMRIAPGGQHTDSLRLSNDSDAPVRVRSEFLDFFLDDTMTPQFADQYDREREFSCKEMLQINPREMDLAAGLTFRVRYTLRVPAGTPEGEYHCGAGFVTLPPINPDKPAMGVNIAVRAVAALYVIVGSPESQPALQDLSLRARPDGAWEAVARFENQGSRHFRIQGFMEVRDEAGRVVERLEYPPIPVLPKRVQTFPLRLNTALAPGSYVIRSEADVGLPEILVGTARVRVANSSAETP